MLGSLVIANYITVTTESNTLSTEVKAVIMLPSEETMLMTAGIL